VLLNYREPVRFPRLLDFLGLARIPTDFLGIRRNSAFHVLGFSWILSSESGLFNGLRAMSREKNIYFPLSGKTGHVVPSIVGDPLTHMQAEYHDFCFPAIN
jgi:hypothetical protein